MSLPTQPVTCGPFYDAEGNTLDVELRFELVATNEDGEITRVTEVYAGFIAPEIIEAQTGDDGVVVVQLFPNTLGAKASQYRVTAVTQDGVKALNKRLATVPNAPCALHTVIDAPAPVPPPVADNLSLFASEDGVMTSQLSGTNPTGLPISFLLASLPAHGSVTLDDPETGDFTYTPNPNYNGTDAFTYQATDGFRTSGPALCEVTVSPVQDAPTAAPFSFSTNEDVPYTGLLQGTDVDGADTLTYSIVSNPSHGSLTLNAATGAFTYTPTAEFSGSDSFTYRIFDGTVFASPATVTITVANVNDTPVASSASYTLNEDSSYTGNMGALDAEGTPLTWTVISNPTHGGLGYTPSTGEFTYTPNSNYHGPDSFTFRVSDGNSASSIATVSFTVNATNDAPVAVAQSFSTVESTPYSGVLAASDVDGDTLAYSVSSGPSHGTLTSFDTVTGAFTYAPTAAYVGSDTFTFRVFDGTAFSTNRAVTITVTESNVAPVSGNSSFAVAEDGTYSGTLIGSDGDGDAMTFEVVANGTHGTATITNAATGAFTYAPVANYNGSDSFTYRIFDGLEYSSTSTVSITVTAVDDAPVAAAASISLAEDGSYTGTLAASDADGQALTYSLVANGTHGTATITNAATGAFTYAPVANYNGSDSFTFRVSDGSLFSNTATVSITVTSVNDAPVANGATITVDENATYTGTLAATDLESPVSYAIVSNGTNGTATITNSATGAFTYVPNPGFGGADSFTFRASDGTDLSNTATVNVNVSPSLRFAGAFGRMATNTGNGAPGVMPVIALTNAGTTATATVKSTVAMFVGQIAVIASATPSAYNGNVVVTSIANDTQFTYTCASDPGGAGTGGTCTINSLPNAALRRADCGTTVTSSGTTATVTISQTAPLVGDQFWVVGGSNNAFNGLITVATVTGNTSFTYALPSDQGGASATGCWFYPITARFDGMAVEITDVLGSGDWSELRVSLPLWSICNVGAGIGLVAAAGGFTIDECAIVVNGTAYAPVKFGGSNSRVVNLNSGTSHIVSDAVVASDFIGTGVALTRGTPVTIKAKITLHAFNSTLACRPKNYAGGTVAPKVISYHKARSSQFAVSTAYSATGFTTSGTDVASNRNSVIYYTDAASLQPLPAFNIIGRPTAGTTKSFMGWGDDPMHSLSDNADVNNSGGAATGAATSRLGWFSRSLWDSSFSASTAYAGMNCASQTAQAVMYSTVQQGASASWFTDWISYCTHFVDGTGMLGYTGTNKTAIEAMWAAAKVKGKKIVRTSLIPRTSASSDSYQTTAGQTVYSGYGVGGTLDTQEGLWKTQTTDDATYPNGPDYYLQFLACRASGGSDRSQPDYWKWVVNGTSNYATSNGVHPLPVTQVGMAAEARALWATL